MRWREGEGAEEGVRRRKRRGGGGAGGGGVKHCKKDLRRRALLDVGRSGELSLRAVRGAVPPGGQGSCPSSACSLLTYMMNWNHTLPSPPSVACLRPLRLGVERLRG